MSLLVRSIKPVLAMFRNNATVAKVSKSIFKVANASARRQKFTSIVLDRGLKQNMPLNKIARIHNLKEDQLVSAYLEKNGYNYGWWG